jgi:hypothetical protein
MLQNRDIAFIVSAILLCVGVYALYPYYQYYVDPDATAYLTIIKRYIAGDYDKAVNGYWSPWSCWLVAGWVKASSWSLMASAVAVNTIGAVAFLWIGHSFFRYFDVKAGLVWLCELTLVVFLSYAVYGQLFDDLWECFFLLAVLRLMLRKDFVRNRWMWVLTGVLGALAYFAKAYAFPFFILNMIVCSRFVTADRKHAVTICAVSIVVMLVCCFPWVYALHDKYGEWMTGTAGKLNLSWYTVGHPYWKEGITHLVPPVYGDSPYYWEDPYMVNGATPNAFSSLAMLKMQLVRIPFNLFKLMRSMSELSVVFAVIFGAMLAVVLSKKVRSYFPEKMSLVAVSFVIFPLGYMLINFEARYLWYMLPTGMVMGALLLDKVLTHFTDSKWLRPKLYGLFVLSFIWFPVLELKKMYKVGADDAMLAQRMIKEVQRGSFTVLARSGAQVQGIERVAYFSGSQFYAIPNIDISHEALLKEMAKYHVKYYIQFYDKADGVNNNFLDAKGQPVPEAFRDEAYGIRVFGPLH